MAPTSHHLFTLSLLLLSLLSHTLSHLSLKPSFRPSAVVLPVIKDPHTLQYTTQIYQRTPLVPVKLTVDLGGQYMWVNCDKGYVSSSYLPVRCSAKLCKQSFGTCNHCHLAHGPGCNEDTCSLMPQNSVVRMATSGEVAEDVVSVRSTDGSNPGRVVSVARFPFVCGSTFLLQGLAKGVKGMAGLGRTVSSLPSQFSKAYRFNRTFAICLSSGTTSNGVIFFGDSPYNFLWEKEISKSLLYTQLVENPHATAAKNIAGQTCSEYFIGVKYIKINGHNVPINTSLLSISKEGKGGTKISTVEPYTIMETSIYNAVTRAFAKELSKVPRVAPIAPFKVCYDSKLLGSTRVGPGVPPIELIMQNDVSWMIFGSNSMVQVKEDVLCLGVVDGGKNAWNSIVIGGHQIEDNLLQFDLGKLRLGFSSSLLFRQTTCGNFNFTIIG